MNDTSSRLLEESPERIAGRLLHKAHNQDGLPEIAIGFAFVALAVLCWLPTAVQPRSPAYIAAICGQALLIPILLLRLQWAIKTVRRKFLIEREGYVESKPANQRHFAIVLVIALAVAVAGVFAAYRGSFPPASWVLGATGIGGGVLAAIAGRLPRFVIGGVVMAVTGLALAFSRASLGTGFAILYGLMGALSLLSGCVVFLLFMRKPAAVEEGE
jgi:MFS family permease